MDVHPLDPSAATPPYEQLRTQIATRVAAGDLVAGTRLPTVRGLAGRLGVAVNTVARAYRELEADGVVLTEGRRGTFVRPTGAARTPEAGAAASAYAAVARQLGLTLPEAVHLLERAWAPGASPAVPLP